MIRRNSPPQLLDARTLATAGAMGAMGSLSVKWAQHVMEQLFDTFLCIRARRYTGAQVNTLYVVLKEYGHDQRG